MAIFYDAEVNPDALTAFVREVPTPGENALSMLFPTEYSDTNTFDWSTITKTNRTAKYRAFDGSFYITERDKGEKANVPLAPLSVQLGVGEYERLQLEFARTSGTADAALVAAIYNDAENLTRYLLNRVEQGWGDVLSDGKLTIDENGFNQEADYGMPGNHSVTPSVNWTTANLATMTPLEDFEDWVDTYVATNGEKPATALMSLSRIRVLQRSKQIIDAIHGATGAYTRVNRTELNDLLQSEGFPIPVEYDRQLDIDGVATRVIADDVVPLLPANLASLGHMRYGLSATALELVEAAKTDMSFGDAKGIVGVVIKDAQPPFRKATFVDAVGQPILADARRLMVATVA